MRKLTVNGNEIEISDYKVEMYYAITKFFEEEFGQSAYAVSEAAEWFNSHAHLNDTDFYQAWDRFMSATKIVTDNKNIPVKPAKIAIERTI